MEVGYLSNVLAPFSLITINFDHITRTSGDHFKQ